MTTAVNPRACAKPRVTYATSCLNRSREAQPHISRTSSLIKPAFPRARLATYCASSGDKYSPRVPPPPAQDRSAVRAQDLPRPACLGHQFTSVLLSGPHDFGHGSGQLLPLRFLRHETLPPGGRQPVVLEFPFRCGPAFSLQAMEHRIKRTMLHLEQFDSLRFLSHGIHSAQCRAEGP
jgi:hypothetical protein